MKRTYPTIVFLISLSLIGIVLLQYSWAKNLLQIQEQRLLFKIEKAGDEVTKTLSKQVSHSSSMRILRKKSTMMMPEGLSLGFIKPPNISQRFTDFEIREMLEEAFTKEGIKNLQFEYAITIDKDEYIIELQSKNFLKESADTLNYRRRVIPITMEGGSDLEGLIAEEHLFILVPKFQDQLLASLTWMIFGAVIFTLVIFAAFYVTVSTLLKQKRLSEIKSDFINNMTHEFKTPIATISLAVDMVRNEKIYTNPEKLLYFSGMIKEENKRMNKHVETILQAATMDKQELKLNFQPLALHPIIQRVCDGFSLQLQEKSGRIQLNLSAGNDVVKIDEVHFTNLINNLIDNAVKYSNDNVFIAVSTHSTKKHFVLRVEDNGIGMTKETVKKIFEKFYRAHTGNVHNVKGFGLGMSYVKTVIDAHKGRIKVDSTLGKGSVFTVEVPLA